MTLSPYPCFRSTLPAGGLPCLQFLIACSTFLSYSFSLTLISPLPTRQDLLFLLAQPHTLRSILPGVLYIPSPSTRPVFDHLQYISVIYTIFHPPFTLTSHVHHAGSGEEEPGNVTKTKHSCSVEGAVYSKCGGGCPLTCGNPYIICLIQGCFPGCMCPDGQLIDEVKKRCVPQEQCPSPGLIMYTYTV